MNTYVHLYQDNKHYYWMGDIGNLAHVDIGIMDEYKAAYQSHWRAGNWYIVDRELDQEGFQVYRTGYEFVGWSLNDDLPEWFTSAFDVSQLPDNVNTDEAMLEACRSIGMEAYRHSDGDLIVNPLRPYSKEYNRPYIYEHVAAKWLHREGTMPVNVPFKWRGIFPNALAYVEEIHHLLPCCITWDGKTLEAVESWLVAFCNNYDVVANIYKRDELYIGFRKNDGGYHESFKRTYPTLKADNLAELLHAWLNWQANIEVDLKAHLEAITSPCPRCKGTGYAMPITDAKVESMIQELRSEINYSWNARGKKRDEARRDVSAKIKAIETYMKVLLAR